MNATEEKLGKFLISLDLMDRNTEALGAWEPPKQTSKARTVNEDLKDYCSEAHHLWKKTEERRNTGEEV